jgi:putative FmdB family regulatory protein
MPTYEYACEKCGHEFEVLQSMSAGPLLICPKELCARKKWGRGKVRKKISTGGGLLFKGSGFYVTDYRSEKYKAAAKKDSAAPATPSGGENKTAKPETKPAAPKLPAKTDKK